ncbi:Pimeloyl-ACP methyl ester carboxylesterase [Lentzea xinjiangensis]|uniref:Pimeloyl-ACP methyl ester carboxylesterase n=1 Tax=Lentzea xinjiangensis TaxID=402600 RepID=A0A1H9RIX6_9PSEU|nr:alpha/beta hydrolase [Lentzea xinjiangensis]SER72495.1 Pimeloyl-ACP methyl ester carboxylesterase [Lentzea xinjiangensis]
MPHEQRRPRRERWDEVSGRPVRSVEAGWERTQGPLVVIVPGLGALGYLVDTVDACAGWARTVLLDVPGFGHRGPGACAPEVPAIAETVSAWLTRVTEVPVVLMGHSTGAQAALHVAAAHPDRVAALALLGPTFPPEQRVLAGAAQGFVRNFLHEPPSLVPATVPDYLRGGPRAIARFVRSAQHDEPERTITGVRCPVLLARGQHDAFVPRVWLDRLTAAAPDGRSTTVPGAHTFPFRRGQLTADLIASAAALRR